MDTAINCEYYIDNHIGLTNLWRRRGRGRDPRHINGRQSIIVTTLPTKTTA
jgi:hypothetical protein